MIGKSQKPGLLWPTLLSALALALLVSLGTWQLHRKAWKDALLAEIHARKLATPVTLNSPQDIESWLKNDGGEYTPLRIRGVFEHDKERYYFAPHQQLGPGYHVYTPLIIAKQRVIWVNRGYVPERLKAREKRTEGLLSGEQDVIGLMRLPGKKGMFSPTNDVSGNLWFWRDLEGMHKSVFDPKKVRTYAMFVEALAEPENPGGWPKGGVTIVKLPNRHFEYALTWFGLALTLLSVYGAFVWQRLREKKSLGGS